MGGGRLQAAQEALSLGVENSDRAIHGADCDACPRRLAAESDALREPLGGVRILRLRASERSGPVVGGARSAGHHCFTPDPFAREWGKKCGAARAGFGA